MYPSDLICITQTEVIGRINLLKLCWFVSADTLLQAVKVVSFFWTNDTSFNWLNCQFWMILWYAKHETASKFVFWSTATKCIESSFNGFQANKKMQTSKCGGKYDNAIWHESSEKLVWIDFGFLGFNWIEALSRSKSDTAVSRISIGKLSSFQSFPRQIVHVCIVSEKNALKLYTEFFVCCCRLRFIEFDLFSLWFSSIRMHSFFVCIHLIWIIFISFVYTFF